jgi:hypothetical protein
MIIRANDKKRPDMLNRTSISGQGIDYKRRELYYDSIDLPNLQLILQNSRRFERNHFSRINLHCLSSLGIPALSCLLGLDRPFAKSGDHDVITLVQIILDDFKEAFDDTDAVFLGDTKFLTYGFGDVNLGHAHNGSPMIL